MSYSLELLHAADDVATFVATAHTAGSVSLDIGDPTDFPAGPFTVLVGDGLSTVELLEVASIAGSTLTLAAVSTQSHAVGDTVELVVSAETVERLRGFALGHTHVGTTDGTVLAHTALTSIGTNTHAQVDTHIAATVAHGATGAVVGTTNSQVLSNKTLASTCILNGPRVVLVADLNGKALMSSTSIGGTVANYLEFGNNIASAAPSLGAIGSDTNIGLNLKPKGTGRVQDNGVIIPNVSSADTLTNKALTSPTITGGSITGITDLAVADGGTGASTATAARSNLGLGTMATQNAAAVAISGGTVTGITDLTVADGGTGVSTLTGLVKASGTSAFTAVTAPSGAVVGDTDSQTLTNKSLQNGTCFFVDGSDATKRVLFSSSGAATSTNQTIASQATTNRTATLPDATGTLAMTTAPTTWTPTVSQSAAVVMTVQFARYQIIGKMAYVQARLTLTSGGTAGNQFIVNGVPGAIAPVNTGSHVPVGTFVYYDASANYFSGAVITVGVNDLRFVTNNNGAAGVYFGNVPSMTLASGDELNFTASWEIA